MAYTPLYIWLLLLNIWSLKPWTDGRMAFVSLLASVFILWHYSKQQEAFSLPQRRESLCLKGFGLLAALLMLAVTAYSFTRPDWLIDIAQNTYAAVNAFTDGNNPYISKAQLWVGEFDLSNSNIRLEGEQVYMFDIPYHYGYPYFPFMLLSYTPAYFLIDGFNAIRLTQLCLVLLSLWGFWLISKRYAKTSEQLHRLMLISSIAYIGMLRYSAEAIMLGVTDILLGCLLLHAVAALSYQRYLLAGIVLGCAQAAKLLPAPLAFLAILAMLWLQPQRELKHIVNFIAGFALSSLMIILPFVIANPEGFLSATILYYLTHHQEGDFTSLWFFLPSLIQPLFLILSPVLALVSIALFTYKRQASLFACMCAIYSSYAIFMAFNKMTHVNYLWGVYPLGCMALALLLANRTVLPLITDSMARKVNR